MTRCPSEQELEGLLADRLPADARTSVEGHVEGCPTCQRQLDALTQADLALVDSHRSADTGPEFLQRVQHEYPDTLLNGATKAASTLRFPGEPTERAPLGQLGDFDILEELGSGSFGWVFRARERSLKRLVALKVLKPEMTARPDAIVRFEREAKKASLKHDHIVSVHRFEKPSGFPPYLVMEYVEGETLEAKLKREGKLAPEEAAAIARQVALGLAAAHEHGMVHRDIKPANILLERKTGRAKISDFGLARDIANESLAVTEAGELAGTVPYMSPEHFRTPEKIDGKSDVFSLGIVLYQMLTGQLPFKGSFLQIRSAILEDEPPSPRRLNDAVPVDLQTITLACLEKDPQRRFATAQALAEDLRRFQNGEPILCRPTGRVERAVKWAYRKPAQAMLLGVGTIAIAILAVLIAGFFVNAELHRQRDDAQDAKARLEKAKDKLTVEKAVVRRLSYIADMNLAHQAWQNDNFGLLDQYLTAHENSELRGFEWHYLRWLASTDGMRIGPKEEATAIAFDRNGQFFAVAVRMSDTESHVQIWSTPNPVEPRGKWVQTVAAQKNEIKDVVFHRDGIWLVTSDRAGAVTIWDRKQNKKRRDITGNGPLALSPDGELLAYVHPSGAVQRWSFQQVRDVGQPLPFDAMGAPAGADKGKRVPAVDSNKENPRLPSKETGKPRGSKADDDKGIGRNQKVQNTGIQQLAFSHDGKRLAIVGGFYKTSGVVALWNLSTDYRLPLDDPTEPAPNDLLTSVAFSADGKSMAFAGFDHVLRVADAKTGKARFHGVGHKLEVLSVAFNQNGERIASAGWDHTIRIWDARTGEELRSLRGNRGVVSQILFCPDAKSLGGDHLLSLNDRGELRWWNADHEQNARVTHLRDREPVQALAFSPKGKYLAVFGRKDQVFIQTMAPPHSTIELSASESRGVFSDDENALFTLGRDRILQVHPFAKDDKAVDVPNIAAVAGNRVVATIDGKWMLSRANPNAREPLQELLPFGTAVEPTPALIAADAAGSHVAFAKSDGGVVMRHREVETGMVTETILDLQSQTVNALAFSRDGRRLAVSVTGPRQDYAIWLWDVDDGKVRHNHKLTGHLCFIGCLAFSPDGNRLASGSEDWTVKVWDLDAGRATLTLSGHKGRIRDLAFSPDGNLLASASEDGSVRVWPGMLESEPAREERREPSSKRAK